MRLLPLSTTYTLPDLSSATLVGNRNCPFPEAAVPNAVTKKGGAAIAPNGASVAGQTAAWPSSVPDGCPGEWRPRRSVCCPRLISLLPTGPNWALQIGTGSSAITIANPPATTRLRRRWATRDIDFTPFVIVVSPQRNYPTSAAFRRSAAPPISPC